jgi:hypothetical protein
MSITANRDVLLLAEKLVEIAEAFESLPAPASCEDPHG